MLGKCIWIFNIFPFFVTTAGSLVWSLEHFVTKETLHKIIVGFIKIRASTG
jgi:hypothetical protein